MWKSCCYLVAFLSFKKLSFFELFEVLCRVLPQDVWGFLDQSNILVPAVRDQVVNVLNGYVWRETTIFVCYPLDKGWEWYVCEGFQYILKKQAEALQKLGVCPRMKVNRPKSMSS